MKKNVFFVFTVLFSLILFGTCKVGLGSSVDINDPKLEIKYPASGSVIKDTFTLYGTCSDDKSINRVEVSVLNGELSATEREKEENLLVKKERATVSGGQEWSLSLNQKVEDTDGETDSAHSYNGWQFADGKIIVRAIAYDDEGRNSGTYEVTYDIDNTAPVLIASAPGVVIDATSSTQKYSEYGTSFSIKGEMSEDHSASINVAVYNESDDISTATALLNKTFDYVKISETSPYEIARSVTGSSTSGNSKKQNYIDIYVGADATELPDAQDGSDGTKKFKTVITLTDSAKVYVNPKEITDPDNNTNETTGNSTTWLFLYSDVYSTYQDPESEYAYTVDDFKELVNETKFAEGGFSTLADFRALRNSILDTHKKSDETPLAFSLNPYATPTYSISGFCLGEDGSVSGDSVSGDLFNGKAAVDSTIVVVANKATGSTRKLDPSTFKLWAYPLGSLEESVEKATVKECIALLKEADYQGQAVETVDGSVVKKTKPELQDSDGNEVELTDAQKAVWNNLVLLGENSSTTKTEQDSDNFEVKISEDTIKIESNKYYLLVATGSDVSGDQFAQNSYYGFIGVDNFQPASISETAIGSTEVYKTAGGELTLKGVISKGSVDIASVYIEDSLTGHQYILDEDDIVQNATNASNYNWSYTFIADSSKTFTEEDDYQNYVGAGEHTFTIRVVDAQANKSEVVRIVSIDMTPPDISSFTLTPVKEVTSTVDEQETVTEYVNGKITVSGTATDSNAFKAFELVITDSDGATVDLTDSEGKSKNIICSQSYDLTKNYMSWSYVIDTTKLEDDKTYTLTVNATDGVGNSGSNKKEINIRQSTDTPSITLNNAESYDSFDRINDGSTNIFGTVSNNKISATVSDDDGISSITVTFVKEGESENAAEAITYAPGGKTTYSLNCQIPSELEDGGYTVTITVKDTLEETSVSTLEYKFCIAVSSAVPAIQLTQTNDYSYYRTSLSLNGTVSGQSVKVKAAYPDGVEGNYSTESTVSTTTFTDAADISALADNKKDGYSVTYTATDRWGQSAAQTVTFYKDITAPVLDGDSFMLDRVTTVAVVNNSWFSSYNPSLTIKYSEAASSKDRDLILYIWVDPSSGAGSSVVKSDKEKYSSKLENKASSSDTVTFSTVISLDSSSDNAEHTVYVMAEDLAGNESGVQEFNVHIDLTAPSAGSKFFRHDNLSGYEVSGGEVLTNKQNDIYFYGTVSDSLSGVAKIDGLAFSSTKIAGWSVKYSTEEIKDTYTASTFADFVSSAGFEDYGSITDKTAIKSWQIIIPKEKLSTGELTAVAYDNAGLQTNISIAKITVDISAPVVNYDTVKDADADRTGTYVNKKIQLTGTTKDSRISEVTNVQYRVYESVDSSTPGAWNNVTYGTDGVVYKIDSDGSFTSENADSLWADDSTAYSWKTNAIDTQSLFADSKTKAVKVDFRIVAADTAGNDSIHTYSQASDGTISSSEVDGNVVQLYVDQSTDRPKITITNLDTLDGSYLLNQGTSAKITGQITDDDSNSSGIQVKKLIISDVEVTDGNVPSNGGTTTLSNSGTFTFVPAAPEENGPKKLYIYVEDNQGGVFYTTATTETAVNYLANPKITVGSTDLTDEENSKVFEYKFDSESPKVTSSKGILYFDAAGKTVAQDSDGNDFSFDSTNSDIGSGFKAGGTARRYIKFKFEATDANGIAGMTLKPDESTTSFRALKTGTISSEDYEEDGTFSAEDTTGVWTTGIIDLSEVSTGTVSAVLTVFDKSNRSSTQTLSFSVDNKGPSLSVNTPSKAGTEVTGSVTLSGTVTETGDAGVQNVYWLIPTSTQRALSDTELAALTWNGGTDSFISTYVLSTGAWGFCFDGKYNTSTSDSTNHIYKAGNPKLEVYDSDVYATVVEDGPVYTLPVYFKIVDKFGNYTIQKDFYVKHNPDGDKPKVKFTYPTSSEYKTDSDYVVLGGIIRTTGTAEIPSGTSTVNSVYYQLGSADGADKVSSSTVGTVFGDDAKSKCEGYGYTVVSAYDVINEVTGSTLDSTSTISEESLNEYGFESIEKLDAWWGIKAGGTASWNVSLNSKGELNPSVSSSTDNVTTNLVMRACGVNADGKFGNWTTGEDIIAIHIDNTAPVISAVVNQYPSALATGTLTADPETSASQNYDAGMYLKGSWYLVVDVLDETGVTAYTVNEDGISNLNYSVLENVTTGTSGNSDYKKGYRLYIPVNKDKESVTYTVTAQDANHNVSSSFEFNIDNKAPVFSAISGNGTDLTADSKIADSNYRFTLSDTTSDSGSGLNRVAFYFVRKNPESTKTYSSEVVLDPMITTGTDDTKISLSDLEELTITQDTTDYTLYAKKQTGSASTVDTFTLTGTDSHIRAGGLIYIDGVYRLITKIENTTVTFEPSLAKTSTSIDAYFPIAQIVDNTANEKISSYADNPFNITSGDDGDGMPESFSKSGSNVTWDASIHTTNMPDGPVSLVVLAFDKAGNVSGRSFDLMIANNAPRMAKLWLGTDLNGDGKYSSTGTLTEFVEYDIIGAEGTEQSACELDFEAEKTDGSLKYKAGKFSVKNGLAVVTEFTGGNGEIGMVLNTSATDTTATGGIVQEADSKDVGTTDTTKTLSGTSVSSSFTAYSKTNSVYAYVIAKAALGDDSTKKAMSFTFWDSTEETVQGSTSQNAVLYIPDFVIAQTDKTAPVVRINPFYWNSSSDNSLYGNSLNNGHIELEADWKNASGYDSTVSSGEYDGDPKVSGKVVFTGTAYDNSRIAELTATYGTLTATVSYNSSTGKWSSTGTLSGDGYEFKVYDADLTPANFTTDTAYFDQNGHKVYWTLTVDTEKVITDIAAADQTLTVLAKDASSNETGTTAATTEDTDASYNKPTYQTDVVPYVTGVTTSLSTLYKRDPSVYARSALGKYSVYEGEEVNLSGFNLGTTTTYTVSGSGEYVHTVNGIKSLNNKNNNDSKGSLEEDLGTDTYGTYAYNRQPNSNSNRLLTDNVEFAVWHFDSEAARPISGKIEQPVMKINPVTGNIGFAFVDGPLYFSMGGAESKTDYSYNYWVGSFDFFTSVGFVYDKLGYSYATAAGGDINSSQADKFSLYTSRWGVGKTGQYGSYDGSNALRLETIAQNQGVVVSDIDTSVADSTYLEIKSFDNTNYKFAHISSNSLAENYVVQLYDKNKNLAANGKKYIVSGWGGSSSNYWFKLLDIYGNELGYYPLGSKSSSSVGVGTYIKVVGKVTISSSSTYYDFDKQRIKSPAMATTVSGETTNLYMAYYDAMNSEIRFKAGSTNSTSKTDFGSFIDSDISYSPYNYKIETVQVIASENISDRAAGEYVSIAAIPNAGTNDDLVAVIWYADRTLWYSYNTTPQTNRTGDVTASGWSTPVEVFDQSSDMYTSGEYCKIIADEDGNIHIAAYDPTNLDLNYAFLSGSNVKATSSSDFETCIVDSYGVTGSNLTLDVAKVGSNWIPYIGYYATSCIKPKYAYKVVSDNAPTGAENDWYTQNWEIMVIPSQNVIEMQSNQHNDINIGVWKDKDSGLLKASITGTKSQNHTTSGYNSTNNGIVWGNGTSNAVLGYAIKSGPSSDTIETAQLK